MQTEGLASFDDDPETKDLLLGLTAKGHGAGAEKLAVGRRTVVNPELWLRLVPLVAVPEVNGHERQWRLEPFGKRRWRLNWGVS